MNESTRPAGVTAVAVLCWLLGAADIFLAALLLVAGSDHEFHPAALVGVVVVGLVYIAAGTGVFRGVDAARVIVLLGGLISFAAGLYGIANGQLAYGVVTVAVTVAITVLLWTGRGSDWFSSDRGTSSA